MLEDRHDGSASADASRQVFFNDGHGPEPAGLGLETLEPQVLLGTEDRGMQYTAGLSHKPSTHQLPSPSLCHGPGMALLRSPDTFQGPSLATKSASAYPNPSTNISLIASGPPNDYRDLSPRPRRYEILMQTSAKSRIPTRRIKEKSPHLNENVQAADKKAQAEKHRKSEQKRRKGTSHGIWNIERHIPIMFLDGIKSRSTKLRLTNHVPVSVSKPSKNGVLDVGDIYMVATEDELTDSYEREEKLRHTNAAKDKLIQVFKEFCQREGTLDAFNAASVALYPTPPDSPKLNKRLKFANSLEADGGIGTSSPPSKRTRHETYDADAEWSEGEDDWQDRCPKPHEGKAWGPKIIARMEDIQRRSLGGSNDVSPAAVERISSATGIDVERYMEDFDRRSTINASSSKPQLYST